MTVSLVGLFRAVMNGAEWGPERMDGRRVLTMRNRSGTSRWLIRRVHHGSVELVNPDALDFQRMRFHDP